MDQLKVPPLEPTARFQIVFRDREHFYSVVNWMNRNVGRNKDKWKINSSVLKKLSKGRPVRRTILVFVDDFDVNETALFLNLS